MDDGWKRQKEHSEPNLPSLTKSVHYGDGLEAAQAKKNKQIIKKRLRLRLSKAKKNLDRKFYSSLVKGKKNGNKNQIMWRLGVGPFFGHILLLFVAHKRIIKREKKSYHTVHWLITPLVDGGLILLLIWSWIDLFIITTRRKFLEPPLSDFTLQSVITQKLLYYTEQK